MTCRLSRIAPAALLVALSLCASEARAQKLTVQGDRFAIDGTPRFLTFISYFGAMGAPNVIPDLHLVKSVGFDGIRIWPNLDTGPQLMNGDGTLRPEGLTRLRVILDQARLERLVVDVTFTYEHIAGMTPATARTGILAATDALREYDNLLFDIQNERNVPDRRYMGEADVASIFNGIKTVDPARIATADNSLGEDWGPQYAADFTARIGLDVTAFHETRRSDWYTLAVQQPIIQALRSNGKPAYMQEPMATRDSLFAYPSNSQSDYFFQAMANAKLSGAAAWCFHTEVAVDFNDGGPPFLEDRLRAHPEPEWAFVNALETRVTLRTSNGSNYVTAEGGGGGTVRADRTAAGPWETFTVTVLSGGPMLSGDRVALLAADGTHWLQATGGGGSSLRAAGQAVGAWETFVVQSVSGDVIRSGDPIAIRAGDPWYVVADGGGGGTVSATSVARGPWETFTVAFVGR